MRWRWPPAGISYPDAAEVMLPRGAGSSPAASPTILNTYNMEKEELKRIIDNHQHWINKDVEGWKDMKANLGGADLRGADLKGANLGGANLGGADLGGANLRGADLGCAYLGGAELEEANLRGANLGGANLKGANLRGANLGGADLEYADLRRANLGGANLRHANLKGADLGCADLGCSDLRCADLGGADLKDAELRGANLRRADLEDADLRGADLRGADLRGANLDNILYNYYTAFLAIQCPEEGSFIGWKKVNGYVVKLRVPEDAKRSSSTSRKCRCSHAEVLAIQKIDGTTANVVELENRSYLPATTYKVGEIVRADKWDSDRWNECSHGIHFFISRDEAVRY